MVLGFHWFDTVQLYAHVVKFSCLVYGMSVIFAKYDDQHRQVHDDPERRRDPECEAWVDRIIPPTWRTLKKKPGGGRRGGND